MKEKIDFLLKERQKIWFKEGASKNLRMAYAVFDVFLMWGALCAAGMAVYQFAISAMNLSLETLVGQNQRQEAFEFVGYSLCALILLSFFVMKLFKMILDKRGFLNEENGACVKMIELVEQSKEARIYRDGVVSLGLPLLAYDLEKVKEIISGIENKEAENKRKMLCQKAHGLISE